MRNAGGTGIYGGQDPREIAAYNSADAAHYLRIPENTIRAWAFGRSVPGPRGVRRLQPLIAAAGASRHLLSFVNVLEIHVLDAIRRYHSVDMKRIRAAIDYLGRRYGSPHPLIDHTMETDGVDVFIRELGILINASKQGQLGIKVVLDFYLHRIERNDHGIAIRLFPFARKRPAELPDERELERYPRTVVMDPRIAFGRPVIVGSGVPPAEVADRFNAGRVD